MGTLIAKDESLKQSIFKAQMKQRCFPFWSQILQEFYRKMGFRKENAELQKAEGNWQAEKKQNSCSFHTFKRKVNPASHIFRID